MKIVWMGYDAQGGHSEGQTFENFNDGVAAINRHLRHWAMLQIAIVGYAAYNGLIGRPPAGAPGMFNQCNSLWEIGEDGELLSLLIVQASKDYIAQCNRDYEYMCEYYGVCSCEARLASAVLSAACWHIETGQLQLLKFTFGGRHEITAIDRVAIDPGKPLDRCRRDPESAIGDGGEEQDG